MRTISKSLGTCDARPRQWVILLALASLTGNGAMAADDAWLPMDSGVAATLVSIWGSGPEDIFVGGSGGTILHYNGAGWSIMTSGTSSTVTGIWGVGPSAVYAATEGGTVLSFDGSSWSIMDSLAALKAIWGSGPGDIFAVGWPNKIFHYDGSRWSETNSGTSKVPYGVWGSGAVRRRGQPT